jgi:hypothetical protein
MSLNTALGDTQILFEHLTPNALRSPQRVLAGHSPDKLHDAPWQWTASAWLFGL